MNAPRCGRASGLGPDVAIAALLTAVDTGVTLVGGTWWPDEPGALAWALLVGQALACLSLVARRRAPLTVIAVLGGYTLLVTLLISPLHAVTPATGDNVWAPFSTAVAAYGPLYYAARNRESRGTRWVAWGVLVALSVVVARPWEPSLTVITIGLLRTALGPLVGLYADARRRLVQALTERAERAERERHLLAEQARAEERTRLAGEMHDVVTHRVSLMVLQAGALRMTATDEATRQAAEELRAAGCQALDELRDLVGILRAPSDVSSGASDSPGSPGSVGSVGSAGSADPTGGPGGGPDAAGPATPTAADLDRLVAESNAVGVATELVEVGDRELASPVVGRTAYRVVREALTNVRKHALGARVVVRVAYAESGVRVEVRNTPPTGRPGADLAATGSGLGIAHLRQRIELVHGTLRAGPTPDGGFRVAAELPGYVPTAEAVA